MIKKDKIMNSNIEEDENNLNDKENIYDNKNLKENEEKMNQISVQLKGLEKDIKIKNLTINTL